MRKALSRDIRCKRFTISVGNVSGSSSASLSTRFRVSFSMPREVRPLRFIFSVVG